MITKLCLLMLICSPFTVVPAQSITGRVIIGPGRIPLRRAVVELMIDSASKWVDSTTADVNGVFYLNAPRDGTYYIQIANPAIPDVFFRTPALTLGDIQRDFEVPWIMLVVSELEAGTPAQYKRKPPQPKYPRELEKAGVEGSVLAQFVVDTSGRVMPGTFRVLRSTHLDFSRAVSDVTFRMLFDPARISGRPVRQVVQQRFDFTADRFRSPSR